MCKYVCMYICMCVYGEGGWSSSNTGNGRNGICMSERERERGMRDVVNLTGVWGR